jgi:acetylornithine deacetylase
MNSVQILDRLIGFPTVSRDSNLALIDYVRDFLATRGIESKLYLDADRRKANLYASIGPAERGGVLLSGHTDVVPVDGQQWDTDPFRAVERDGKLFARGSADMKGFIGIILAQAPKFVKALNDGRLDAPLHYSLSYDEEVGCVGVRGLIRDLEENHIRPAGCVVGEPTSMQPIIAHKSTNKFRCAVHGREAHSSYVTHGVNAIEYAARLVVFVRQVADRLAQAETRDYGFTVPYSTLSTGMIRGGIAFNVVPKDCVFHFDMRTLPHTSADGLYQEIHAFAQRLASEMQAVDAASGIELEWLSQTQGLAAAETDAIVQWAMQLSRNSRVGKVSYGTEAGLFQKMGVPSVICGPGDIAQAHRPNEFVTLEQLAQCEKFMDRILDTGYAA